jgi:nitronate monooxygenase
MRSIVFDISRRNVWPAPFTGRCLRNSYFERWYGREVELLRTLDAEAERLAEARRKQDFDIAPVIAGEASGLVREILSAREIVDRITREAETLLSRGARQLEAA